MKQFVRPVENILVVKGQLTSWDYDNIVNSYNSKLIKYENSANW